MRGHLTPEEAGGHARGAGAKRLLLVHISDELDADWARDQAAEAFGGPGRGRGRGRHLRSLAAGRTRSILGSGDLAARPVRELRAHAARDGRAVRRGLRGPPGLRGRGFSPRVDVYYTDNPPRAVVKVDLAAVDPADVALEIRGRQLVIAGERRPGRGGRAPLPADRDRARPVPARRRAGRGRRAPTRRRASYVDGVLQVEIPLARAGAVGAAGADLGAMTIHVPAVNGDPRRRPALETRAAGDAAGAAAARHGRLPRHDAPAGRRPGALDQARRRRARRQPDAGDGRLEGAGGRGARARTSSTAWASWAWWRG